MMVPEVAKNSPADWMTTPHARVRISGRGRIARPYGTIAACRPREVFLMEVGGVMLGLSLRLGFCFGWVLSRTLGLADFAMVRIGVWTRD